MTASMTRALEQALRSICRCKREGYKRQGRIDHKRLTAISKGLSREVFFKVRDGQNLECAVEIIIDESGSMGNYREVRLLAIAIGEALSAIGVPFEITGTTTKHGWGSYGCPPLDGMTRTNPIIYNHYVKFGEAWQSVRHRLIHTGAHVHNIDGEAIEYCAFRLASRKERRKIIFSLSDGSPCGGQGTDSHLGQNIKRVCEKARKNGMEVYGFGVNTMEPRRFYGDEFFVYLEDATTMDQVFIRKFAQVVTGGRVRI
jgi:cobalamin biosynthesis protein CobT